jgi:hypothetical protein
MGHRSGRWEVVPGAVPISRRGVEPLSQRIKKIKEAKKNEAKVKEAKKARPGEFESTALLTGKSEYPPNQ